MKIPKNQNVDKLFKLARKNPKIIKKIIILIYR